MHKCRQLCARRCQLHRYYHTPSQHTPPRYALSILIPSHDLLQLLNTLYDTPCLYTLSTPSQHTLVTPSLHSLVSSPRISPLCLSPPQRLRQHSQHLVERVCDWILQTVGCCYFVAPHAVNTKTSPNTNAITKSPMLFLVTLTLTPTRYCCYCCC